MIELIPVLFFAGICGALMLGYPVALHRDAFRSVNTIGEMGGDALVVLNKSTKAAAGLHGFWPKTVQHGLIEKMLQSPTVN